jgi:hypothetical protein
MAQAKYHSLAQERVEKSFTMGLAKPHSMRMIGPLSLTKVNVKFLRYYLNISLIWFKVKRV